MPCRAGCRVLGDVLRLACCLFDAGFDRGKELGPFVGVGVGLVRHRDAEEAAELESIVTVGLEVPLSLSELLKVMTEQRDHALDIAGQYDGVIAAAVNLDRAEKQIMEIEVQMASHRKALAEFISDDLP